MKSFEEHSGVALTKVGKTFGHRRRTFEHGLRGTTVVQVRRPDSDTYSGVA